VLCTCEGMQPCSAPPCLHRVFYSKHILALRVLFNRRLAKLKKFTKEGWISPGDGELLTSSLWERILATEQFNPRFTQFSTVFGGLNLVSNSHLTRETLSRSRTRRLEEPYNAWEDLELPSLVPRESSRHHSTTRKQSARASTGSAWAEHEGRGSTFSNRGGANCRGSTGSVLSEASNVARLSGRGDGDFAAGAPVSGSVHASRPFLGSLQHQGGQEPTGADTVKRSTAHFHQGTDSADLKSVSWSSCVPAASSSSSSRDDQATQLPDGVLGEAAGRNSVESFRMSSSSSSSSSQPMPPLATNPQAPGDKGDLLPGMARQLS